MFCGIAPLIVVLFANGPSSICSGSRTASISSSPTRSPGDSLGDFPLGNGHGAMKCGVHNPFLNKILNVIPKKCHTSWKISDKLIYPLVPSGKRLWKITTISMGKSTISTGPFGASIANSKRLHRDPQVFQVFRAATYNGWNLRNGKISRF